MTDRAFRGRRRSFPPVLASVLLHGGAVLALAALHIADPLPAAPQEQGVEIVWQDRAEDSAPGEEATAPPAKSAESISAEAPPQEPSAEPEQEVAETPSPPLPQAEAPEQPAPEPSPPEPALAEAPLPEVDLPPPPVEALPPSGHPLPRVAEAPLPAEPPPPQVVEAPPQAEPAEARAAPPSAAPRAPDLPLPPPTPPAPPRAAAPRQQAASQVAASQRQAPPGPATQPESGGGSRAIGVVSPPGLLDGVRNPEPEYPPINRQRGDQGVVTVLLRISEAGEVTEVEVIATSGYPTLDDSARRAVQRWRFRPATRDGVPVAGSIRTAIHFRLR